MSELLDPLRFPLHGSRLIEASAGTGKTWTIAALYVRLVLGHGGAQAFPQPMRPEQILVVTFTRAATEELRDRIRARLTEAAAAFRDGPADPFLSALRNDYPVAQWPLQAWWLEVAATSMDQAAVATIHGWCQRMLRQHAVGSGTIPATELSADERTLREAAARDYWRRFIQPQPIGVIAALQQEVASPELLAEAIRGVPSDPALAGADHFLTQCGAWRTACDELEGAARSACAAEQAAICDWFAQALEAGWLNGNSHRRASVEAQLQALCAWASGSGPCDVAKLARLRPDRLKFNKSKPGRAPEIAALAALTRLLDHHEQMPSLREPLLRHAAAWCAVRLQQEKQLLDQMGYDDLLVQLHAALSGDGGAALAAALRAQFPVALIDEFQDTDPQQYAIFRAIYGVSNGGGNGNGNGNDRGDQDDPSETPCALLMIGDPKQAIYAFRGADIHAYLQARRDTRGRHYTLGTNFRSTEGLVAAVNTLFARAETLPDGPFLQRDEIPFEPVGAAGRSERLVVAGQMQPALTLWQAGDDAPQSRRRYQQEMAVACAGAIAALLRDAASGTTGFVRPDAALEPLRAGDIAILVRTGREAQLVRRELACAGIRSVYLSDRDSVYASPQALDLLMWLEAVAAPGEEALLRRALASATLALSLAELDRLVRDEQAADAVAAQFQRYRQLWADRGVLPLVRALIDDFAVASRWLGQPQGERVVTNLLQLAELLQRNATGLDGPAALLRDFADRIEVARRGDANEEHVLRLESDADLIRVVTMHKSKGLEYPLVFIPFACGARPVRRGAGVVSWHAGDGSVEVAFDPDDAALAAADRERLAEDLRLLYVALTRARHACWVGMAQLGRQLKERYQCELRSTAIGYLLTGGGAIEPPRLRQLLGELTSACPDIATAPLPPATVLEAAEAAPVALRARTAQRPPAPPWWIGSYSGLVARLAKGGEVPVAEASGRESLWRELRAEQPAAGAALPAIVLDDPDLGIHRFPAGSGPGSFLHDILEWAAGAGFARAATDATLRRELLLRRCERRGWSDWVEVLDRWLLALLTSPLPLVEGSVSLAALAPGAWLAEMEFLLEARTVPVQQLDRLVTAAILPGAPRPRLEQRQLNGMLKGYIDLLFEHAGRYYVVDYKSNWLGATARAYDAAAMDAAILAHRYELQYTLYTLALHRLLRARLPGYDYDRHVGGALYLFLRGLGLGTVADDGTGIHRLRPPRLLIEELDQLFSNGGAVGHG